MLNWLIYFAKYLFQQPQLVLDGFICDAGPHSLLPTLDFVKVCVCYCTIKWLNILLMDLGGHFLFAIPIFRLTYRFVRLALDHGNSLVLTMMDSIWWRIASMMMMIMNMDKNCCYCCAIDSSKCHRVKEMIWEA